MFTCGAVVLVFTTVSMVRLPRATFEMRNAVQAAAIQLEARDQRNH
jgi:hypothetical protein